MNSIFRTNVRGGVTGAGPPPETTETAETTTDTPDTTTETTETTETKETGSNGMIKLEDGSEVTPKTYIDLQMQGLTAGGNGNGNGNGNGGSPNGDDTPPYQTCLLYTSPSPRDS